MEVKKVIVCIFSLVNIYNSLKLPIIFKKCDRKQSNFNQCLSDAVQDAIKILDKPIEEYGIPRMDPFVVPLLEPLVSGDSSVGLEIAYNNVTVFGFSKVTNSNASMDFQNEVLTLELTFPSLRFDFNFEAHGMVVFLVIDTVSVGRVTFNKPTITLTMNLKEYEKEKQKYFKVVDSDYQLRLEGMNLDYKLFDNKVLNDAFNEEMSANGEKIARLIVEGYGKFQAKIYSTPFNNLLEKVPVDAVFGSS